MSALVSSLYRYPVKGLSPEPLTEVRLEAGGTVPFDRAYAIENGPGRFDPEDPRYLPKTNFLMLMRNERLATLATQFEDATETLIIKRAGKQVARGQLTTTIGRQLIEQFLGAYMHDELRGAPKLVHAAGHSFSDRAQKCLHIVNLASLRDLERAAGRRLDPLRFRANVYLDGVAAWEELNWLGTDLKVGPVGIRVFDRTSRCAATNVEPSTGVRDIDIPALLQRTRGHSDFGVYGTVVKPGTMRAGDGAYRGDQTGL